MGSNAPASEAPFYLLGASVVKGFSPSPSGRVGVRAGRPTNVTVVSAQAFLASTGVPAAQRHVVDPSPPAARTFTQCPIEMRVARR